MIILTMLTLLGLAPLAQDPPSTLEGPARFCGYSPIIDLLPGETITVIDSGMHGGSFRWEGAFGVLDVHGIGWASQPPGEIVRAKTETRPARLSQRREEDGYVVAIWNGAQGAAYFRSPSQLTPEQIAAIERVTLYQEGETPTGCDYRTLFVSD